MSFVEMCRIHRRTMDHLLVMRYRLDQVEALMKSTAVTISENARQDILNAAETALSTLDSLHEIFLKEQAK